MNPVGTMTVKGSNNEAVRTASAEMTLVNGVTPPPPPPTGGLEAIRASQSAGLLVGASQQQGAGGGAGRKAGRIRSTIIREQVFSFYTQITA